PFCSFLSLSLLRLPLCPTLLPYTTLFRSVHVGPDGAVPRGDPADEEGFVGAHRTELTPDVEHVGFGADVGGGDGVDRSGGSGVRAAARLPCAAAPSGAAAKQRGTRGRGGPAAVAGRPGAVGVGRE